MGLIFVIGILFSLSFLFVLCLINICCPNQHLYLKGIQRIAKFNLARIPRIADESSGLGSYADPWYHYPLNLFGLDQLGITFEYLGTEFFLSFFMPYPRCHPVPCRDLSAGKS
jgi:hypothetical protein